MSENYLLFKVACRFPLGLFTVGPQCFHWVALLFNSYFTIGSCSSFNNTQSKFVSADHLCCALKCAKEGLQSVQILQCIMGSVVHAQQLFDQSLLPKVLQVAAPEHFPSQSQSVDTVDSNGTLRSSSSRTSTSKGPSKWRMLWLTSG